MGVIALGLVALAVAAGWAIVDVNAQWWDRDDLDGWR